MKLASMYSTIMKDNLQGVSLALCSWGQFMIGIVLKLEKATYNDDRSLSSPQSKVLACKTASVSHEEESSVEVIICIVEVHKC